MDIVITHAAGLDVHKASVVATVRVPGEAGRRRVVTATFATMTADLIALREWLQAYGVTHVALESTGVYWKPVYYVLEDAFTLLLINMQELKRVPGRKTDVKSGWRNCSSAGCCAAASSRRRRSANCEISPATGCNRRASAAGK
jgi:transposase